MLSTSNGLGMHFKLRPLVCPGLKAWYFSTAHSRNMPQTSSRASNSIPNVCSTALRYHRHSAEKVASQLLAACSPAWAGWQCRALVFPNMQTPVVRPTCSAAGGIGAELPALLDEIGSDPVQKILGRPFHALPLLSPAHRLHALQSVQHHGMTAGKPDIETQGIASHILIVRWQSRLCWPAVDWPMKGTRFRPEAVL